MQEVTKVGKLLQNTLLGSEASQEIEEAAIARLGRDCKGEDDIEFFRTCDTIAAEQHEACAVEIRKRL